MAVGLTWLSPRPESQTQFDKYGEASFKPPLVRGGENKVWQIDHSERRVVIVKIIIDHRSGQIHQD